MENEQARSVELIHELASLRATKERYRVLIEDLSDWIWEVDTSGAYTYSSPKVKSVLGYSPHEIIGMTPFDLMTPDDAVKIGKVFADISKNKRPFDNLINRNLHKDGHVVVLETSGVPIINEKGELSGYRGVDRDVTYRTKIEEALNYSEQFHKATLDDMITFVAILKPDGEVLFVNNTPLKVGGLTLNDVVGKKFWETYWWQVSGQTVAAVKHDVQLCAQGKSSVRDIQIQTADGSLMWIEYSMHPIFDKDGTVRHLIPEGRDITDRRRVEDELKTTKSYLSNIINSMPSILVGTDHNTIVTQWNQKAEEATGITGENAKGRPLQIVFPRLAEITDEITEAIRTCKVKKRSEIKYMEDEETHYSDITIYPLIADGTEGAVIRIDDTTEKVRLEKLMIQTEKMLSVGGLAAGMAHEINNPLAGIVQNISNMRRRLRDNIPANRKVAEDIGLSLDDLHRYIQERNIDQMMDDIKNSGLRAAEIISNMLSFARKGSEKKTANSLSGLIDKTIDLIASDYDLTRRYDFHQINILRKYSKNVPKVLCEPSKIQQVFLNILKNGAEAMNGKRYTDGGPQFILRLYTLDKFVNVEIEDNGPGMDEKTRKRIFEPFFTTKPAGKGTGLGMSVAYFIIRENHNGQMEVQTETGKWTKFLISLPLS